MKKDLERRFKQLTTQVADLEFKLSQYHAQIAAINQELVDGASDPRAKGEEIGKIQNALEECERNWMRAAEEREILERQIRDIVSGGGS